MTAQRHQIDVEVIDVDRNLAESLGCIRVEESFLASANLSNGFQILDNSDLVVDKHQADAEGFRCNAFSDLNSANNRIELNSFLFYFLTC